MNESVKFNEQFSNKIKIQKQNITLSEHIQNQIEKSKKETKLIP